MSFRLQVAGMIFAGFSATTPGWAVTEGDGTLTVTSQPPTPDTPAATGGDGTITVTG